MQSTNARDVEKQPNDVSSVGALNCFQIRIRTIFQPTDVPRAALPLADQDSQARSSAIGSGGLVQFRASLVATLLEPLESLVLAER
ncbi:hypothetical protein GGQ99_005112 [Aminobacter niigataensis]|uniref:Uncharacterized protein n=1 Tax=Aminobacter niigataensis TaxID=83265 RepID=A0ABR6L926_9HYPH|nr:hypothetical protein [Aminobacter niigataensis]